MTTVLAGAAGLVACLAVLWLFGAFRVRWIYSPVGPQIFVTRTRETLEVFFYGFWLTLPMPLHPLVRAEQKAKRYGTLMALPLVLCAFLPGLALAQTPCDGAVPTDPFVVSPSATGLTAHLAYPTAAFAGVTQGSMQIATAVAPDTPLSTQVVMRNAITVVGVMSSDATRTCYALPVVPVAQIPWGQRLVIRLSLQGTDAVFASLASEPSRPFGQRLPTPAVIVR